MEAGLTNPQIVDLARSLSSLALEAIALKYLGLEQETLDGLREDTRGGDAYRRAIIRHWKYQNSGDDEAQRLAEILYRAVDEGLDVNPEKVQRVLGVPYRRAAGGRSQAAGPGAAERIVGVPPDGVAANTSLPMGPVTAGISSPTEGPDPSDSPGLTPAAKGEEKSELAKKLRAHYKRVMKVDVAPWINHEVDMDKIYTELTLEKLENEASGIVGKSLKDYKDIFVDSKTKRTVRIQQSLFRCFTSEVLGKRILIKGDPGMGKTTLVKKISLDYAKGLLKLVSLVFFVFLKLVRPGEKIEDAIVEQNLVLHGLSSKSLLTTLKKLGTRCLLILDGLDEHALGENEDVLKVIKGEKLMDTHVIVTSRPHSIHDLVSHFSTIVRVNGFTKRQARKFARKILGNKAQVEDVLRFNPVEFGGDMFLYQCPILLSFLCLLVQEEAIDLQSQTVTIGDIYAKMVRCLYKKFVVRENKLFREEEFREVMKKLGSLAMKTLLSGEPLMKRSDVIEEVGKHAFDYGLLIGHDNFGLMGDVTADILVTFPHRSIQEFLGAFFFVLMLTLGHSCTEFLKKVTHEPIFMMNPLFLHFCLWFLYSGQEIFPFGNTNESREKLEAFCFQQLPWEHLDLPELAQEYPAMDIEDALRKDDSLSLKFYSKVFERCSPVFLAYDSSKVLSWVWKLKKRKPQKVSNESFQLRSLHDGSAALMVSQPFSDFPRELLDLCNTSAGEEPVLYAEWMMAFTEMPEVIAKHICTLRIRSKRVDFRKFPHCPKLTTLTLERVRLEDKDVIGLNKAWSEGYLPNLIDLCFIRCIGLAGKMSTMFKMSTCHVDIRGTILRRSDIRALRDTKVRSLVTSDMEIVKDSLPKKLTRLYCVGNISSKTLVNLESLGLESPASHSTVIGFDKLPSVQNLILHGFRIFAQDMVERYNIPVLLKLDLSHCTDLRGNMSILLVRDFPSLKSLRLSDCWLNSEDLASLAKSSVDGRLPRLTCLDVSKNDTRCLLAALCTGSDLRKLNVKDTTAFNDKYEERFQRDNKSLAALEELSVSDTCWLKLLLVWERLTRLCVGNVRALKGLRRSSFPALRSLCLQWKVRIKDYDNPFIKELLESGVNVHVYVPQDNPFESAYCVCQIDGNTEVTLGPNQPVGGAQC